MFLFTNVVFSAERTPPVPTRIGGTVTIDGVWLTQATDTGYTGKRHGL